jgi:sigma-B regulation protein RsbU (phosphoserine phosphatase)
MTSTDPDPVLSQRVTVLLIDDQPMIGEVVRRMIAGEPDIDYHYLSDPTKAIELAQEIHPTVILQDLVMPQIEGLELVKQFREVEALREIPMIVLSSKEEATTKAQGFAVGANDYLVKPPDRIELLARIRYHSKGYIALLQRNEAYRRLKESQEHLASEVASAAKYVQSLLPPKIEEGPVKSDWRFIPSALLSGDTFGYHWIDDQHFGFYLLDVVGHGVGAALLSVSVLNAIRSGSLPGVDFTDPGQVMTALNARFQMSQQAEKCFTAWYGVYDLPTREIRYAGGGHPPALLLTGESEATAKLEEMASTGPVIGPFEEMEYATDTVKLGPYAVAYVYSDGVYEIKLPDGKTWPYKDFTAYVMRPDDRKVSLMDRLMTHTLEISGQKSWEDDFSIFELRF